MQFLQDLNELWTSLKTPVYLPRSENKPACRNRSAGRDEVEKEEFLEMPLSELKVYLDL